MFRNKWWIVVASVLALIVGQGSINTFAAGVFLKSVAKDLNFGRGVISTAIGLGQITTAIGTPFLGRLLDRYGVRPVLLPAIVLFAVATAALSLLQPSTAILFLLFAISGLLGSGQTPTAYSKMISARFDSQRGLALGIALAGVGLGTAIIPQFSIWLLRNFGWRTGYFGLAASIIVLAFIPVALFFREPASENAGGGAKKTAAAAALALPGDTASEGLKQWRFWVMSIAFYLGVIAINGSLIHVVPLLTDRGLPIKAAAAALSASGLALIGGRLVSGYLLDKLFAPYIAIFFMICPMVGIAILGSGVGGVGPVVGTVFLGISLGAEIDLMSYMISCYFGLKAFGTLHGTMFIFVLAGGATGASILGWCFQIRRSYSAGFVLFEVLLLVACILLSRLGAYRYPPRKKMAPVAQEPLAAPAR